MDLSPLLIEYVSFLPLLAQKELKYWWPKEELLRFCLMYSIVVVNHVTGERVCPLRLDYKNV